MAINKCPLCGSRVLNGTCNECGYSVPDETEISSMYNYDPDDDEFGEKSAYPRAEVQEEDAMPEIRVREEVQRNYQNPYNYNRTPNIQTVQKNNIQVQPQKPQQNNANPYANFSPANNQQQGTPNFNAASNPDPNYSRDLALGIVFAFLFWIVGIIYGIKFIKKYNQTKDNKYLTAGIIILAMAIVRFLI